MLPVTAAVLVVVFASLVLTPHGTAGMNIMLISMTFLEDEPAGFREMNPVYDLIIRHLQQTDPLVFANFTHISLRCVGSAFLAQIGYAAVKLANSHGDKLRGDDEVASCFFRFYYQFPLLFVNDLSDQFTLVTTSSFKENAAEELASFIQETPALLALSVPYADLSDNTLHPTTINFFGMPNENFVHCLSVLAQNYQWAGLNVVCGATAKFRFLVGMCDNFGDIWQNPAFSSRNLPFTKYFAPPDTLDSTLPSNASDWFDVLSNISNRRATLLLLAPTVLRKFLITASERNMTNGDYVFVAFAVQGIPLFDDIYWKADDEYDNVTFFAFRSLLIIADGSRYWDGLDMFKREMSEAYLKRYRWAVSPRTQCFKRALPDLGRLSMTQFVQSCANRTYTLPTRSVYLSSRGTLIIPLVVTRLNDSGYFRPYLTCGLLLGNITYMNGSDWFGQVHPPSEFPFCGLHGEKCPPNDTLNIGLPLACIGLGILFSLIRRYIRYKVLQSRLEHLLIAGKNIVYPQLPAGIPHKSSENSNESRKLGLTHPTQLPNSAAATGVADVDIDISLELHKLLTASETESLLGAAAVYRGSNVYIKVLATRQSVKTLTVDSVFSTGVVALSRLRHPYLAEFYGVTLDRSILRAVFERPAKGALKDILAHNAFFSDVELRLTLMANLIEGLQFIHNTDLKYHGAFSSRTCLLNDRYTIRIALAGFEHLTTKLLAHKGQNVIRKVLRLRKKETTALDYQRNDIQNLGMIVTEMFETNASRTALSAQKSFSETQRKVVDMMAACLSQDVAKRPTASSLMKMSSSMGLAKLTVVELLQQRLQSHANILEQEVALRSLELQSEMKKVDDLLNEMLPKAIINKLRNHEAVTAELYESATVLFSDIPVFFRLVSECAPMDVVGFLSQVHSQFDVVVSEFDAYKVETINDSYVVVSGIPVRNGELHAVEICKLALRLRVAGSSIAVQSWGGDVGACPRIGINTGLVAAGVVGTRMPRYCLFGDTMNTASRMESHGAANRIHVNDSTRALVERSAEVSEFVFLPRGLVTIKGKGNLQTYWLHGVGKA